VSSGPLCAESLLAARLAEDPSFDARGLEQLCSSHPELAPLLRDAFARFALATQALVAPPSDSLQLPGLEDHGELGRGGMGVVRQVRDAELRRDLAAKLLRADCAADARARSRFVAEAQLTSQLDHPGVVPVHSLGVDQAGRPFFTMKLIRGRNLTAVFGELGSGSSDWTLPRVVTVLLRVCEAVDYAHEKGVIHRDLKPQNVMVGSFGEVFVMDWGLARVVGASDTGLQTVRKDLEREAPDSPLLTGSGDVVGTPYYMAPEQADGQADVGPPADIYSLGAILYHLLAGEPPYARSADGDTTRVCAAKRAGPPAPLRAVAADAPAELVAICERAMARSPTDRYASLRALRADLSAWLEGRVVQAYERGLWPALRKWMRRNRTLSSLAALLAVAAPTVAVLWGYGRAQHRDAERATVLRYREDLTRARESAATLFPAWPARVPALEAWLRDRAEPLLAAPSHVEGLLAGLSSDVARGDPFAEFLAETYQKLLVDLGTFGAGTGLVASVRQRLTWARAAQARLDRHAARWREAGEAIARADGVTASTLYRFVPVHLEPEFDLVPIGMNPVTKLWEFHHLPSAGDPESVPSHEPDGSIHVGIDTGIVFVLVPGGTFVMGADTEPQSPHYDPAAEKNEAPAHSVALAPFFIARHEASVSQWARLHGQRNGLSEAASRRPLAWLEWGAARTILERHGCALPTEAQWEYAARAGTTTPYWSGCDLESLRGVANLADAAARRGGVWWPGLEEGFDDGFPVLAPIDGLRANPWGLHHVHGNVSEWVRDAFTGYDTPPRTGDGLRGDFAGQIQVTRGGDHATTARRLRASFRGTLLGNSGVYGIGVRAVRNLANVGLAPPPQLIEPGRLLRWGDNGHHYGVVDRQLCWDAARDDAQARVFHGVRGHLVTLTSNAESAFVTASLPVANAWLGAFQDHGAAGFSEPGGGWSWVTGEPFTFARWGDWTDPEPSNFYHGGLGQPAGDAPFGWAEDVAQFWILQPSRWNDVPRHPMVCLRYVIEFDTPSSVPSASTIPESKS